MFGGTSGWDKYLRQYENRIVLALHGEGRVPNCEGLLRMGPEQASR